ncbi:DUF4179 domain-containing protein [Bacillus chungangensis]|uniref:Ribosomal protein L18/cell division protein FtsL n=1 Tax=Bacillus chungangensis TaxID=587633 RepID=A0ABT9WRN4_9BACI|nr:DUF4179 domain-containing protein [Bacillus chungangensis]MDQ0175889.1 ribosomal protein L18/cell division protein FtsL [Bacillus chungangensis]
MNKNEHYKLEKKLEQVKTNVPTAFSAKVDETLLNLSAKKKRMILTVWSSTAAIAIVSVLMVSSMLSPTFAKSLQQIPVVGSVFHLLGEKGLKGSNQNNSNAAGEMIAAEAKESKQNNANIVDSNVNQQNKLFNTSKQNNANIVGQEISSPSSTLKITDVVYDGIRLSLSYIQELHDDNAEMIDIEDMTFKADGKLLDEGIVSGAYLNKNKYAGIISFSRHLPKEDAFTLTLNVEQLGYDKGNWSMALPVKKQASGETYVKDQQMETDEFSLHLRSIQVSPTTVKLGMRMTIPKEADKEETTDYSEFYFRLLDENGLELKQLHLPKGTVFSDRKDSVYNIKEHFEPIGELPKVATLQIIKWELDNEAASMNLIEETVDEQQLPLKLVKDGIERISIEKIEHFSEVTVVTYRSFGSHSSLSFTDESGKAYKKKADIEKVDNEKNLFKARFERFSTVEKMNAQTIAYWTKPIIVGDIKEQVDEQQLPLKLAQDGVERMIIEKIEHEKDSTVVTYRTFGALAYSQANNLSFTDTSGKVYDRKNLPERISNKENLYQQRFERFSTVEKMNAHTMTLSEPNIVGEMKISLDGSSN